MSERPEFTEDMAREALAQPAPPKWTYTPTTLAVRAEYMVAGSGVKVFDSRAAAFDRWFAEEIRKAKEGAWDEGWQEGYDDYAPARPPFSNPYKENS